MAISSWGLSGFTRRHVWLCSVALLSEACQPSGGGRAGAAVGRNIADPAAQRFYAKRAWRAAWDQASTQALMQAIANARSHGLDPRAFAPKQAAGLSSDEALTLAALGYAKALAFGLIDPSKIEPIFTLERNRIDVEAGMDAALERGDLAAWLASLAPSDPEYQALSAAYLAALGQSGLSTAPAQGAPADGSGAPANRSRQLAANLERRRWLQRTPPPHRIDVNTAGAFLDYFRAGQPVSSARTVVGRDDHPTPSIQATFDRLVVNPPWRVPTDIAEKEILPKGPRYLAREHMHFVGNRIEQAPGPGSALGLVKFDVDDPYDIYLHDTPSKALFNQPERHRSHGCVRVQNAVNFARSVAAETGQADAFDQALATKETHEVPLGQTISVRMLYHTAYLDDGGTLTLAPDVYGTDDTLAAALGFGQAAAAARPAEPSVLFGP